MTFTRHNLSEVTIDKPLTLLCHKDDIELVNDRDDLLEITPETTLAMAAKFTDTTWKLAQMDDDFKRRLRIVFPDLDITKDERHLREYPVAYRHVVGLIVCTNMAINTDRKPFWRTPETYLHPSSQTKLADLAVSWIKDAEAAAKTNSGEVE